MIASLVVILGLGSYAPVNAAETAPVGFHLLEPHEIDLAVKMKLIEEKPLYLTVPMSIYDRRIDVWNEFFQTAKQNNVVPIVRWITRFDNGVWVVPTRKDIVEAVNFLRQVKWSGERIIVLFNEPNHAVEWGGSLDPAGYARMALFAASWLKTENVGYIVLPAGLDGDAPSNLTTMDSFAFIAKMQQAKPELFEVIDAWTSHSYPNPAFSASVHAKGKNSVRGFEDELVWIKQLTGKSFDVYITETGWKYNTVTARRLPSYYRELVNKVWSDSRVKAVTVFVLKSVGGPFAEFSLLDGDNQPTAQLRALQQALSGK